MPELGRLAICLALLFAAYATGVSIVGAIRRRRHLVRSGAHAAYAVFALVVVAVAILLRALLAHDFSLEYVAAYSSSTLPVQYTVAPASPRARAIPRPAPRVAPATTATCPVNPSSFKRDILFSGKHLSSPW